MTDLSAGNSAVATEANPTTETDVSSNGTSNQNGEASQSATVTESFIPEGVDLNTLPPNVRAMVDKINKDMVRGFTEKTTKLSETVRTEAQKATEAYRQKAEYYDSIAGQEEFVKQWNEYVQKVNTTPQNQQAGDPKLQQMEQTLNEMKQKIQISELSQITEAFADAVDEKGQTIHPQFDELNQIHIGKLAQGDKLEDFSLLRGCVELAQGSNPQDKLANGYKAAKAIYDQIFESGKKAGMGRLQAKAQNGTLPPSSSNGDSIVMTDKKPKSAREALEMARKGQMVSRE